MLLIGVGLGLLTAGLWGTADFVATLAARRIGVFRTVMGGQIAATVVMLIVGGVAGNAIHFSLDNVYQALPFGVAAGITAALGYLAFYQGLFLGPIAIVSPITSAYSAVTLLLALVFLHEHLQPIEGGILGVLLAGIILASTDLKGIRLAGKNGKGTSQRISQGVSEALLAMLFFGLYTFFVGAASTPYGWYIPVLMTRFFATICLLFIFLFQGVRRRYSVAKSTLSHSASRRSILPWMLVILAGVAEAIALIVYSIDTQITLISIVAVTASTATFIPTALGVLFFRERLRWNQWIGIILVIGGIIFLALN
jgi:drug/metabolite transporter (DMT)-like permease